MTDFYNQSMAKRQHDITSNDLSETATDANIRQMQPKVRRLTRELTPPKFESAANVVEMLDMREGYIEAVDSLAENVMKTIPEEDESGTTQPPQRQSEREARQSRQAVSTANYYQEIQAEPDTIETSFRPRLMAIYGAFHSFICCTSNRPTLAKLSRLDREVIDHVARVAYAKQQLESDVKQMRTFLREQLFDQYCLMKGTPMEKKDKTWLRYGKSLSSGTEICRREKSSRRNKTADILDLGDREIGDRLERMMEESGLDSTWAMDRIEDYHNGNDHIGRWQQLAKDRRFEKLAAKLTVDIQQLEKINSAIELGRCSIMTNICNTKGQFFKRLDGAQDFELSEKAWRMIEEEDDSDEETSDSAPTTSRMSEEDERTSHSLPTISVSAVNKVMRRRDSI